MRPLDLARLATLRERREEQARRAVRARMAARDTAMMRIDVAALALAAREGERGTVEKALRAQVGDGPVDLTTIMNLRSRIAVLGHRVTDARSLMLDRRGEAKAAHEALAEARANHAARARDARRWESLCARLRAAQRASVERAEEAEAEDETLDRLGAVGSRR